MALDAVPKSVLNDSEISALVDELDKLELLVKGSLNDAQQVQTVSEEAYNSYTELSNDMRLTNESKNDALTQIQG